MSDVLALSDLLSPRFLAGIATRSAVYYNGFFQRQAVACQFCETGGRALGWVAPAIRLLGDYDYRVTAPPPGRFAFELERGETV